MVKLYDLAIEYAEIGDAIDDADGELTPEIEARLDALSVSLEAKVDSCCALIREWSLTAEAIREEERRLKARRDALDNRAARLREYVTSCLDMAGRRKVTSSRFTASVRESRGAVSVTDIERLPAAFKFQRVDVDKRALRAALDAGEEVPGAVVEPGRLTLTIR